MPRLRCFIGLGFILAVVFSFVFLPATAAAGHSASFQLGSASYMVDGQEYIMDAKPYMKDGRIFVPVRYLAYACGLTEKNIVYENGVIRLTSGDVAIQMAVGDRVIVVNGLSKFMDVAPEQAQGRTYLPARYIAEALGYTVHWDASTQTVSITRQGEGAYSEPNVLSVGEVVEIAQPAVVLIQTSRGQGSGFFWSSDGEIITNAHVVAGARDITVTTFEGRTYRARIEKLDAYLDIAILKVDGEAFTFIPHYNLELKRGDEVVALTNPLGLKYSASKGIISAIRDISEVDPDRSGIRILQTDASVLPGSSGGPLLNMYGEVVGIIFSGKGVGLGLNFALPINYYFTVAAKPPFGVKDDFLLYLEEDKKWVKLHNQFVKLAGEVNTAISNRNTAAAIQLQALVLSILDDLQQQVGSYYPQTDEVDGLRRTYLESIRNYYAGNAKLLEGLQFFSPWTATQASMAFSEADRYLSTANRLLDKYNRDKKDLFERLFSLR